MKKILAIVVALTCVCALCSCTPEVSDIKDTFKENGYAVSNMDSLYAVSYGANADEVEYVLIAIGGDNSSTVCVVGFSDKKAAKEFEKKQSERAQANFKCKRKGSAVIFGSEQGVELF